MILSLLFAVTCLFGIALGEEAGQTESTGGVVQAASLPVMCFSYEDLTINPTYGYIHEVSGADEQSVFPFTSDELELKVLLLDGSDQAGSVTYELRSEEGRLVARGASTALEGERGRQQFTVRFEDILQPDTYYHLRFTISIGRQDVWYYTRVIQLSDPEPLTTLVNYAAGMHRDLFQRDTARKYAAQLETDTFTDKNTLANVTINGTFDQLVWGERGAKQVSDTWMTIEGVQDIYTYLSFSFLTEADYAEGETVRFRVRESMTLQYSSQTIYVLQYDRHAEQLWDFESNNISTAVGFLLGVQEAEKLQRLSSKNEKYTAFTVAGELFCYDASEQILTRIFSFRQSGEHELRTLQRDYSLRIMDVGEDGTVDFIINGYMNGGSQEGNCGLSYCSYEPKERTVRENISLSSSQCATVLLEEMSHLLAKGNDHFLYFAFDRKVLVMDISTGETAVLVSPAEYRGLVINEKGRAFAWPVASESDMPSSVRVVDLNRGSSETVHAAQGDFIAPLGYIQEDLIMGYGDKTQILVTNGREDLHAYNRFVILNPELKQLHAYAFEDVFIDHIDISAEKVTIHRFGMTVDGEYHYLDRDVMLRNDGDPSENLDFSDFPHETLKNLTVLSYARLPSSLRITRQSAESFVPGQSVSLPRAEDEQESRLYFAYGRGALLGSRQEVGEAILLAGPPYGYVLDESGRLVWCWSARGEVKQLTPSPNPLAYEERGAQISGISFRQMVYYLNVGIPVYWVSPEMSPRWLIGYNWDEVLIFLPEDGSSYRLPIAELDSLISRENNYLWYYSD